VRTSFPTRPAGISYAREGARRLRIGLSTWCLVLAFTALAACAHPFAESYEFVYGPLPGSERAIFDRLTRAVTERGAPILESDAATGRLVVSIRGSRGAAPSRVTFQCFRGGFVRSTVEDAEPIGGVPHRIRMPTAVRTEYEAIAVGLLDALESDPVVEEAP
jgi:hypothetical protein